MNFKVWDDLCGYRRAAFYDCVAIACCRLPDDFAVRNDIPEADRRCSAAVMFHYF